MQWLCNLRATARRHCLHNQRTHRRAVHRAAQRPTYTSGTEINKWVLRYYLYLVKIYNYFYFIFSVLCNKLN